MELRKRLGLCLFALLMSLPAKAEFAYFGLEPDIVTNYLGSSSQKLGYVRVTVELMLKTAVLLKPLNITHPIFAPKPLNYLAANRKTK